MEYTGAVGTMLSEHMAHINRRVPEDEIFGGDRLRRFIGNYQDQLVRVEDNLQNLITMVNHSVWDIQICDLELKGEVRYLPIEETLIDKGGRQSRV